ncbi:MAG: hypothetical protein ACKV19_14245 [Verrucomicrobiales bacterium]
MDVLRLARPHVLDLEARGKLTRMQSADGKLGYSLEEVESLAERLKEIALSMTAGQATAPTSTTAAPSRL